MKGITRSDFASSVEPIEKGLSSNRPANPVEGRVRYETDTNKIVVFTGSSWEDVFPTAAGPGGGAPDTADYLVGTAQAGLSAEIVVGTAPGGELGGTWASPTVDASHSGSTHAAVQAAAEATAAGALSSHAGAADPHTGYVLESLVDAKGDLLGGSADNTPAKITVGADRTLLRSDANATPGVRWGTDLMRQRSTGWHYSSHLNTPTGVAWPIINRAYYTPWFLPGRNVITAVGVNVAAPGTATNVVRLGIYSDSGSFAPGTILDQGTVAGDATAFCTWTPSSPVAVTDQFWMVACPQGSSTPGSTWLSLMNAWGVSQCPPPETGAAWAGTYVTGIARYSAESGAFTNNPSLTLEVQSRNPYLGLRLQ
jgi:hypothetical protein